MDSTPRLSGRVRCWTYDSGRTDGADAPEGVDVRKKNRFRNQPVVTECACCRQSIKPQAFKLGALVTCGKPFCVVLTRTVLAEMLKNIRVGSPKRRAT